MAQSYWLRPRYVPVQIDPISRLRNQSGGPVDAVCTKSPLLMLGCAKQFGCDTFGMAIYLERFDLTKLKAWKGSRQSVDGLDG